MNKKTIYKWIEQALATWGWAVLGAILYSGMLTDLISYPYDLINKFISYSLAIFFVGVYAVGYIMITSWIWED